MVPGLVRAGSKVAVVCALIGATSVCIYMKLCLCRTCFAWRKKKIFFHLLISGFGMHLLQKKLSSGKNVAN